MTDMVNHPPHYKQGSIECIDAIEAALGPEGFRAYCRGTVIKYAWRAEHKGNPAQDLQKAKWYANRCSEVVPAPENPKKKPLFTVAFESAIPGFTELLQIHASALARAVAMEREGKIQSSLAQQIISLQESHRKSLVREHDLIQELEKAKRAVQIERDGKDHFFKVAGERLDEIAALRNQNEDLMKRLNSALASIQDLHSILGEEFANEGIRLKALRVKGERDEARQELASIDAVLANRMALDPFKTRAEKVGHLIKTLMVYIGPTK